MPRGAATFCNPKDCRTGHHAGAVLVGRAWHPKGNDHGFTHDYPRECRLPLCCNHCLCVHLPSDAFEQLGPVSGHGLSKKSSSGIPDGVFATVQPAPVGRKRFQENEYRLSERCPCRKLNPVARHRESGDVVPDDAPHQTDVRSPRRSVSITSGAGGRDPCASAADHCAAPVCLS